MNTIKNIIPIIAPYSKTFVGKLSIVYGAGIMFGGLIGAYNGLLDARTICSTRKEIRLSAPLHKYNPLVNSIIVSGIYATSATITAVNSMAIVATCPISVPLIIYFSEDKSENGTQN